MSDLFGGISIEQEQPEKQTLKTRTQRHKKDTQIPESKKKGRKRPKRGRASSSLWRTTVFLVAGTAACSLVLCFIFFFGIPYYISRVLPDSFNNKTNLHLEIPSPRFSPFNFTLNTGTVTITDNQGEQVAHADNIELQLLPLPLLRTDLVCSKLNIDRAALFISREVNGSYNYSFLNDSKTLKPTDSINGFSDLPFYFSINNISVKDSSIIFEDRVSNKTHKIEQIQMSVPTLANVEYDIPQRKQPHFSALVNGSPFELRSQSSNYAGSGNGTLSSLSYELQNLQISEYREYLPQNLPVIIEEGLADGTINFIFTEEQDKPHGVELAFDFQIEKMSVQTKDSSVQTKIPKVHFTGTYDSLSNKLKCSNILFQQPVITSNTPLLHLYKKPVFSSKQESPPNSPSNSHPFSLIIDSMRIKDAVLTEMSGPEKIQWRNVQLVLQKEETGDTLSLTAQTGKTGKIEIRGDVSQVNTKFTGNIQLTNLPASFFATAPRSSMTQQGRLSGKGRMNWPALYFQGDITLHNWKHKTPNGLVISGRVDGKDLTLDTEAQSISIANLTLKNPLIKAILPRESDASFPVFASLIPDMLQENKKFTSIAVNKLTVSNGKCTITSADEPSFILDLATVNGTMTDITNRNKANRFTFTFNTLGSTADLTGHFNNLNPEQDSGFVFTLPAFNLTELPSAVKNRFNLSSWDSKADLSVKAAVTNKTGNLEAKLDILDILALGTSEKDTDNAVPFAILAGKDKVYSYQHKVENQTNIFPEILLQLTAELQNVLVKGEISPLLLADNNFTELIDADTIEFVPGEFKLTDQGHSTLIRYNALLAEYPYLGIVLSGGLAKDTDKEALRERLQEVENLRIEKENKKRYQRWQEQKTQWQARREADIHDPSQDIQEEDIPAETLHDFVPLQPESVEITDSMLLEMASGRLAVIADYLVPVVTMNTRRVMLKGSASSKEAVYSAAPGVTVKLVFVPEASEPQQGVTDKDE